MSESEKLRKIFIGGLNWETSEEGLKDYFSKWGTIVDCVIMKKDGKSRGFGFVTYASSKSVDDCLKVRGHILDDREIEPKRSIPKDEAKNPMAMTKTRKIFVGGLASTTTEDDIREYFTKLCEEDGNGQVIDIDLKRDKENNSRIRGFAFVTFDNEEIAEKVCAMKFHEIRMKQCEVKKAEPQSMLRKKHEDDDRGSYSSDRDRGRDRDRDSRDRGDRDRERGDRDRSSRDRERSRDGDMSYFNPFGFNPAAFSAGFGPGFGFGGMGFGGFPGGFGYGGFPTGFGMGGGFGGFGPGGSGSDRGGSGSSYDKSGYGSGYRSSSDREGQSSKSQSNGSSSSTRGSGSYDQTAMGSGYGYSPFASMGGSMPSGDWSNFPAAAMMGMYGYNTSSALGPGSDSSSKGYTGSSSTSDTTFPIGNYGQMSSSFGPLTQRSESTPRGLGSADSKSRSYRPY